MPPPAVPVDAMARPASHCSPRVGQGLTYVNGDSWCVDCDESDDAAIVDAVPSDRANNGC